MNKKGQFCRLALVGCSRGCALGLGLFIAANLLGSLLGSAVDANTWWIDLGFLPECLHPLVLLPAAVLLPLYPIHPRVFGRFLRLTMVVVAALWAITLVNSVTYYYLLWQGSVRSSCWFPFSLLVNFSLVVIAWGMQVAGGDKPPRVGLGMWLIQGGMVFFLAVSLPLAQMVFYGTTDYRRPAAAAVVLGCLAWPDGRLSHSLEDRVRTGCNLYRQGLVRWLIFSGGPLAGVSGPGMNEPTMMRRYALRHGVPTKAIIIDPLGVDTGATAANMVGIFTERGIKSALVVSHFYHLARIKLSFQRVGLKAFTVPAKRQYTLPGLPFYMAREVVALWVYYLRSLLGGG